jgi:hypothetical protein
MAQQPKLSVNKKLVFIAIIGGVIDIAIIFIANSYLPPQNDITLYLFGFGNLNKHFQSENNKIIMHSGHGFLAPYDQLTAGFNFMNRYDEPVEVATTIIKQVGDQPTSQLLGDYFVAGNKTDYEPYVFHVSTEGENDIRFVITLKNSTSHLFIQNLTTPTIPLPVESVSSKLQEQANTITFSTLIVSGIIGGGTVYALIGTKRSSDRHANELKDANKLLAEQNKMYREQFRVQNRPWIAEIVSTIAVSKMYNDRGEYRLCDQYNAMSDTEKIDFNCTHVDWSITIKNFGKTPAFNACCRTLQSYNSLPEKQNFGEFGSKFVLMPDNKIEILFTMEALTSNNMQNRLVNPYLCFDCKYGSSSSKQEFRYGFTALMTGGTGYRIKLTWDEESFEQLGDVLLDIPSHDNASEAENNTGNS